MGVRDIPYIEIPGHLRRIIGEPTKGTRMFRRIGRDHDFREWWDAVCESCGPDGAVSPGGASLFAGVSRMGVHKRMKEGRITAFLFHLVENPRGWTVDKLLGTVGAIPYTVIPVIELKAWGDMIRTRMSAQEALAEANGDGDGSGAFMNASAKQLRQARRHGGKRR